MDVAAYVAIDLELVLGDDGDRITKDGETDSITEVPLAASAAGSNGEGRGAGVAVLTRAGAGLGRLASFLGPELNTGVPPAQTR